MICTQIMFEQMSLKEAERQDHISKALCALMRRLNMEDTPIVYIEVDSDDIDIEEPIMRDMAKYHFDEAVVVTSAVIEDDITRLTALVENGFEDLDYGLDLEVTKHRKFFFTDNTAGKKIYDEYIKDTYKGEDIIENS